VVILSLSGLLVASASLSVEATYPGTNDGRLAFGMIVGGNVDVYSVLPSGDDLRRLTTAPSFDACASYSPDGKEIAFCSTRSGVSEIWKMKKNGTQQVQVTHLGGNATFPDFSPDGSMIVFGARAGGSNPDIWIVNSDGSGATRLTSGPDVDMFPAWSPDGSKIVFIRNDQVWTINADGGGATQLTFDPAVKGQVPDWSPDSSKIAYNSGDDIWIMNANGGDQHPLFLDPSTIEFGPAWSPVGDQIAFVSFPLGNLGGRTIYVINADGTGMHAVHPGPGPQVVPAWQPRGDRID
jgi:TolB protein